MSVTIDASHWRYRFKSAVSLPACRAADLCRNRGVATEDRLLVLRHPGKHASMFRDFHAWVRRHVPELRRRLEFRHLPFRWRHPQRYAAQVSWIHDTMEQWSPEGFSHVCDLLREGRDYGIRGLNPADRLRNVGKLIGAGLMRAVGVRTPLCHWVPQAWLREADARSIHELGLQFPVLVREQSGHGCQSLLLHTEEELHRADLCSFRRPILAEYIDTRSAEDGRFRKYRYLVAGDAGVPRHLITDEQWDVRPHRRVRTPAALAEERDFVGREVEEHEAFQAARRSLGMDIVAFDYSYTRAGELIVWEANPTPDLNCPRHVAGDHLMPAVERTFALVARCYLAATGAAIPNKLADLLGDVAAYDQPPSVAAATAPRALRTA